MVFSAQWFVFVVHTVQVETGPVSSMVDAHRQLISFKIVVSLFPQESLNFPLFYGAPCHLFLYSLSIARK